MRVNPVDRPDFSTDYTLVDRDTGVARPAPIPVSVFTKNPPHDFLGIGTIIGSVPEEQREIAVIEVRDPRDAETTHALLGTECLWDVYRPENPGSVDPSKLAAASIANYVKSLPEAESI